MRKLPNIHPCDILLKDFLEPLALSQNALARAITEDTALRLARFFGTSRQLWLGLQNDFDLEEAERHINYAKVHQMQELRP